MRTVTVGGVPLELVAPARISERWMPIAAMRPGSETIVFAAALGLCSPVLRKQVPWQYDTLAFGAAILDFVMSPERRERIRLADGSYRDVKPALLAEVIAAGGAALRLCNESRIDVEGAADFTPPPERSPTPGGRTSAGESTSGNS